MELTITQNGGLYALQHGAPKKYPRVRQKPAIADLSRILPTLPTSMEEKVQSEPQNAYAFPEYRVAA